MEAISCPEILRKRVGNDAQHVHQGYSGLLKSKSYVKKKQQALENRREVCFHIALALKLYLSNIFLSRLITLS